MTSPARSSVTPTQSRRQAARSSGVALNLAGLDTYAESALRGRLQDGSFTAWARTVESVHHCAHPIRLAGRSTTYLVDSSSGEIGQSIGAYSSEEAPLGVLYRPCGNRRADVCPACSRTYARDTFELIRAGLVGGKTVPATVADNPLLFITLTAPTFGLVHGHRRGRACRPRTRAKQPRCQHGRPTECYHRHDPEDAQNGVPLCDDCYDWESAVIWQWWAPELWRRTTIAIRRLLAHALEIPESHLRRRASVQFAKVAEYQSRGMVHFHALLRLDGDDGPGSPAPLDARQLARIVESSARSVSMDAPPVDSDDVIRDLSWGRQLDIKVVRDGRRPDDPASSLQPEQVAGYLAKYATKDANSIRSIGQPRPHLLRMGEVCRQLATRARRYHGSQLPNTESTRAPYALLAKWSSALGFRGHFSTKSRSYSVTLKRLRRARHRYRMLTADSNQELDRLCTDDLEALLLADDDHTTLVVGEWSYEGTGWANKGDEALALAAAARAREYAD